MTAPAAPTVGDLLVAVLSGEGVPSTERLDMVLVDNMPSISFRTSCPVTFDAWSRHLGLDTHRGPVRWGHRVVAGHRVMVDVVLRHPTPTPTTAEVTP